MKAPISSAKNHRRGTERLFRLPTLYRFEIRDSLRLIYSWAFRHRKRSVLYTPLGDPSMAPIHSVRERRHPSVYAPAYSMNVRAHHKLKERWRGGVTAFHYQPLWWLGGGGRDPCGRGRRTCQ